MIDPQTSHRRRWVVWLGIGVFILLVLLWRPLKLAILGYVLLHSEAPTEEVLSSLVQQSSNPTAVLERLWASQRIPHRQFVLGYLGRRSPGSVTTQALEPLLVAATSDIDVDSRRLAFSVLSSMKHPSLRHLALQQLTAADPAVRLLGVQQLRELGSSNDVAIAMHMLADPEPRIVVAAAQLLRRLTGEDFGIKSTHAIPQFTFVATNPPPAPNVAAINHGVKRWQAWWNQHSTGYVAMPSELPEPVGAPSLETLDFTLRDAAERPFRLSRFRGKVVLLAFWSLDVPPSLDVSALNTLQRRMPAELIVVGICVPPVPSCGDEHGGGHHDENEHGLEQRSAHCDPQPAASDKSLVQEIARSASFPMLIDPQAKLSFRFKIEDRPLYVLIDPQGRIGRRMPGTRTELALRMMIKEASVKQHDGTPGKP